MYISDTIRRSGRSLKSAKARTILTALAIAVGTFALTLTLAASNGAKHFVDQIISNNFDPAELIVAKDQNIFGRADFSKPQEYDNNYSSIISNAGATAQIKKLNDEDVAKLKSNSAVESVRLGTTVGLQYITRPGQKKYVATVQVFSPSQNPVLLAGNIPKPLNQKRILIPEGFLSALGFDNAKSAVGQKLIVTVKKPFDQSTLQAILQGTSTTIDKNQLQNQLQNSGQLREEYTIVGVMKKASTSQPGTELYLFLGADDVQALSDFTTKGTADYHKYVYAYVKIKNGNDPTKLKVAQDSLAKLGYNTQSVQDTEKFLTQIITVLQGIVAAFGAIAVIASVFGIVNTMYISVLQRTREVGLMKALGMRKKDIGRLFRFEAAWIGLLGGLLGSVLAVITGILLNPWLTKKLDLGDGNRLLIFKINQIVVLIVLLMIIATIAGLLPARKAAKLDPIEAMRTE